jgi:hypothetical protein
MKMKELWEVRIGFLNVLVAALGIIVSVLIYGHGLKASIEQEQKLIDARATKAYERQLWDEKRFSYKKLAETLGEISADIELKNPISNSSLKNFYKAYWGTLILVENEAVRTEMVKLKNDLRDLESKRISSDKIKLRIQRIVTISKGHISEVIDESN